MEKALGRIGGATLSERDKMFVITGLAFAAFSASCSLIAWYFGW
jgi:hypothetical protein